MLYKLSHPSYHASSYLLGTMHAQSKSAYTFYPKARNVLTKVKLFAAEIDLSHIELTNISEIFQFPDERKLQDYLSKDKYQKIRKQLIKSFQIDLDNLSKFQPVFIINQMVGSILDVDYPRTLDAQLFEDAKDLNLEIGGLESINDQVVIVSKLHIKDQIKQLKELSKNPGSFRRKAQKLSKMYASNETQKIYKSGKSSLGKFKHTLLKERNIRMVDKLNELAKNQETFAAVGAAHLHGKYGFIKLLKNHGWKIKSL